jgi:hypothetical protein
VGQSLSAKSMAVIRKNSAWLFMSRSDLLGRMNVEMTVEDQNSAQGTHTCTRRSLNAIAAYVNKGAFEKQAKESVPTAVSTLIFWKCFESSGARGSVVVKVLRY